MCVLVSVCPLVFPHMRHISANCSNELSNQTSCCRAMESYVSHLQKQSLITNLQALDCATSLGTKLQKLNITKNVFTACHISLKDFSLQGSLLYTFNIYFPFHYKSLTCFLHLSGSWWCIVVLDSNSWKPRCELNFPFTFIMLETFKPFLLTLKTLFFVFLV